MKLSACALLGAMLWTAPILGDEAAQERGEALYAEGLRHLQEGRPEQALAALDASAAVLPSPNTDLLRAHALRSLGRRVEAMLAYERVVRDAGARVRAGDARYEPTLADAGRWGAFLRTALGELTIEINVENQPFRARVDGNPVELASDARSGVARVRLWREPGRARIDVRPASGAEQTRVVDVAAGEAETVRFDLVVRAVDPSPPQTPPAVANDARGGPPLASYVAWGVGAAGFVVLAVAGGLARASMAELDECRPSCTKAQANDAETKATVANVGLLIGIAGAATGGAIWLGAEMSRPAERTPGSALVTLSGSF